MPRFFRRLARGRVRRGGRAPPRQRARRLHRRGARGLRSRGAHRGRLLERRQHRRGGAAAPARGSRRRRPAAGHGAAAGSAGRRSHRQAGADPLGRLGSHRAGGQRQAAGRAAEGRRRRPSSTRCSRRATGCRRPTWPSPRPGSTNSNALRQAGLRARPTRTPIMQLTGIHHLTAVTGNAPRNHDFYTQTLGLRLVKKTVNQDDVSAYHLFYADGRGSPGTDITFFDWPVEREQRGTHSITRTGMRVSGADTLAWWKQRFQELGVTHSDDRRARRPRSPSTSRTSRASASAWSTTAGRARRPIRGSAAPCRPSTRSAASARSRSACLISNPPTSCSPGS